MKNLSILIIILIIFSSCSKMSMDFAKRKYRSGYYVQLSTGKAISRQPIVISQKSSTQKVISQKQFSEPAIIEPAIPDGRRIPVRNPSNQSSNINQKHLSSTTIKNNIQNVPVYNRSENWVIENKSIPLNVGSDDNQNSREWCKEALNC